MAKKAATKFRKDQKRRLRRWLLIAAGITVAGAYLTWYTKQRAKHQHRTARQPNPVQWWLMGLSDKVSAFVNQPAAADAQEPIRVRATTGEPARPHSGAPYGRPVDVDAQPVTEPAHPKKSVPRDDERDSDAWTPGGASTIPAHHRQEYTGMTAHMYVEQLVEGFNTAFSAYRPNVDDGTDVIVDLEHHTLALAAAFDGGAVAAQGFADWIRSEYPSNPGLADFYEQISRTLQFSGTGATEAASAHRAINASAFELRDGSVPNPYQANIPR